MCRQRYKLRVSPTIETNTGAYTLEGGRGIVRDISVCDFNVTLACAFPMRLACCNTPTPITLYMVDVLLKLVISSTYVNGIL